MAVVKSATKTTLGLRFLVGAGESGAALYKKYSFATVKPTAIDQNVFDVGASIGGLLAGTINDVTRNDEFDLAGE